MAVVRGPVRLGDLARREVAMAHRRLSAHSALVRATGDPEAVHQSRVAARRLRSALRLFRGAISEPWADATAGELRRLGAALGRVRDLDVLALGMASRLAGEELAETEQAAWLFDRVGVERRAAWEELVEYLASDASIELMGVLRAGARALPAGGGRYGQVLAAEAAKGLLSRPWKALADLVAALPAEPSQAELHQVRIYAKRLRYASEALAVVTGKRVARLARGAQRLQGVLGDLHDAALAERWLASASPQLRGEEAVVAGILVAAVRSEAAARRSEWRRAWAALERRKVRQWLD